MKKTLLIAVFLLFLHINIVFPQVIKIENGISLSYMAANSKDELTKTKSGYNFSIGLDYWEHEYFNLSSQIGYMATGGEEDINIINEDITLTTRRFKVRLNNLHLNTTIRIKYPIRHTYFYLGIGPKLDLQLGHNSNNENIYRNNYLDFNQKKILFGLKTETGCYYDINNKWRFDLNGAFLPNLTHPYKLKNRIFSINIGIGYKL